STASEHIDRLYKTKYIFKHTPEDDQRKVVLSLTDKGLVVYHQYNEIKIQFLRKKFFELNEKEAKMFIKTLGKFQMNG
ncbi:MAG: MarR family winged helix-turn-helix transcriptional regulator, partial [Candidatus Thorarchaeota archaeon]